MLKNASETTGSVRHVGSLDHTLTVVTILLIPFYPVFSAVALLCRFVLHSFRHVHYRSIFFVSLVSLLVLGPLYVLLGLFTSWASFDAAIPFLSWWGIIWHQDNNSIVYDLTVPLLLPQVMVGLLLSSFWTWQYYGHLAPKEREEMKLHPPLLQQIMTRRNMKAIANGSLAPVDGMAVGVVEQNYGDHFRKPGSPMVIHDSDIASHMMVFGATGSGKTTFLLTLMRSWVAREHSTILIDMGGDSVFASEAHRMCQNAGIPFHVVSFHNPGDHWPYPGKPTYCDLLKCGDSTSRADQIFLSRQWNTSDEFYSNQSKQMLRVAAGVISVRGGTKYWLKDVKDLCDQNNFTRAVGPFIDAVNRTLNGHELTHEEESQLRASSPKDYATYSIAKDAQDVLNNWDRDFNREAKSTRRIIDNLIQSPVGDYLCDGPEGETVDIVDAITKPGVLVFSLSKPYQPEAAPTTAGLIIGAINNYLAQLTTRGQMAENFHLMIDEAGSLVNVNIGDVYRQARKAGCGAVIATQGTADLLEAASGDVRMAENFLNSLIGNSNVIVSLQVAINDAKRMSEMTGEDMKMTYQDTIKYRSGMLGRSSGLSAGESRTQAIESNVVESNDFIRLKKGECFIMIGKSDISKVRIIPENPDATSARRVVDSTAVMKDEEMSESQWSFTFEPTDHGDNLRDLDEAQEIVNRRRAQTANRDTHVKRLDGDREFFQFAQQSREDKENPITASNLW